MPIRGAKSLGEKLGLPASMVLEKTLLLDFDYYYVQVNDAVYFLLLSFNLLL